MKIKLLFLSFLLMSANGLSQVSAGQVADFEYGTTQNWVIGSLGSAGFPPTNVATIHLDNITASTTLAVNKIETQNSFDISPNPATSKLNINLSQNLDNATVTVYDVLGKKIYSKELHSLSVSINVSNWNTGVYLVRISTNKQTLTKRFVKQ